MRPLRTSSRTADHPSAKTRQRLLEAAERLFAERGFRATSVRALTAAAACNLASVNYHFGGKEGLYRSMFERRLVALREQRIAGIRRAMDGASRPSLEGTLGAFTNAFLEPHLDQSGGRRLMRLFSRELLDPHLKAGSLHRDMVEPVRRALTRAIQRSCPGLEARTARRCAYSLVAQLVHVVQMRNAPGAIRDTALRDMSLVTAVDHIVRFSSAGIRACRTMGAS